MGSKASSVRREQVMFTWPIFREYLTATWPEELEVILFQALRGHYQLWLVIHNEADIHGMFVTAITLGHGRVLELKYLTGGFNREDFRAIHLAMLAMQKHSNAIRIEGTPDFKAPRFLKSLGASTEDNSIWRN